MPTFRYAKLVRDNIATWHEEEGHEVQGRRLAGRELLTALINKLHEEADEVDGALSREELTEEIGDVQQVIDDILITQKISRDELDKIKQAKAVRKGGFMAGEYIESVTIPDEDDKWAQYCRKSPEKYPEIKDGHVHLPKAEWLASIQQAGVVVACVIQRDGKYLMVQEAQDGAYGLWNLPAGHVDRDEKLEDAAVREVREETGFVVELEKQIEIIHETASQSVKHVYTAKIVGGEQSAQQGEILQVAWLTLEEISQLEASGKLRKPWVWEVLNA